MMTNQTQQQFIQICGSFYPKIQSLLDLLRQYNSDLYSHSFRTAYYSYQIGICTTSLSENELFQLVIGALLHDFGKLQLDIDILQKPGALTIEEFALVKKHTLSGHIALLGAFPLAVDQIALLHHEKLDGSGYPYGLNQIPNLVQMVTVADMFDAMTSRRSYKEPYTPRQAIEELYKDVNCGKLNEAYVLALAKVLQIQMDVVYSQSS